MHCLAEPLQCLLAANTQRFVGHPACAQVERQVRGVLGRAGPHHGQLRRAGGPAGGRGRGSGSGGGAFPRKFILPGCLPNRAWHCISDIGGTELQRWHLNLWAAVLAMPSRSCLIISDYCCVAQCLQVSATQESAKSDPSLEADSSRWGTWEMRLNSSAFPFC